MPDAAEVTTARPESETDVADSSKSALDPGYLVICWNDPVNLMVYVSMCFKRFLAGVAKRRRST